MDRSGVSRAERCRTVPDGGFVAIGPLLHASGRDGREPRGDAPSGRAIYPDTILRDPEDAPLAEQARLRSQHKAGKEAPAENGLGSDLREAAIVDIRARPSDLSLSFERIADRAAQPGMGDGYHIYPTAARFCVSGGNHGLVQSLCPVLGGVPYAGRGLLPGGAGVGIENSAAGDFEFGPGLTIHKRTVHRIAAGPQRANQHGWTRACAGQHLHRALMADSKIRRGLPEGLRRCPGSCRQSSDLFRVLQSRTDAPILGLSDAGSGLPSKEAPSSQGPKIGHGNDRVAVRSSIVGQLQRNYFSGKSSQAEYSGKSSHRTFAKALGLLQRSYEITNSVYSIIMDQKPGATIHLKEAIFLSKEWGTPHSTFRFGLYIR